MHNVRTQRPASRRAAGAVLGRIAVAGGLVAAGSAFGVLLGLPSAGPARAGEQNFVRSASHEAITGVRVDEEFTITFNAALWAPSVGPDTILLRTGSTKGEQPRGDFVLGRFLFEQKNVRRRVVIRPEALREYYQLVWKGGGTARDVAARKASDTIKRVESTGNLKLLANIDKALVKYFGATYGAGTRLDNDGDVYTDVDGDGLDDNPADKIAVVGTYPAVQAAGSALQPYRELIAGDDVKWQDYLNNGNFDAFVDLQQNPNYERFYHDVDPGTGIAAPESVLRGREYRRVMFDRRAKNRVLFVPEVPIRADMTDTGYKPSSSYTAVVPAWQPGVFNTVLTQQGRRPLLQHNGRDYSTYFNTITGTAQSTNLFLDGESRKFQSELQKPRVINITPPNGETYVDPTTDWEDPDNQALVPVSARKTFTIRLRFAQALDPRTVSPTYFTITQTKQNVGSASEKVVSIPIACGTFLNQQRLGKVEVEMTPATNLEGDGEFTVTVSNLVRSLGQEQLNETGAAYKVAFVTGAAEPPLDAIREDFINSNAQADPNDPDTLGQRTTAYWPSPALYDPTNTGRCVAKFMPFVGSGVGAPQDPRDLGSPIVEDLVLGTAQDIVFATEQLDPGLPNFGKQIEYNYKSVAITAATVTTVGRYPLVIRSQSDVRLTSAFVLVNGQDGGNGRENVDRVNGEPTGGLGGAAGPGGHRGGDGGGAPVTDQNNNPVLAQGRLQFDQAKFAGKDGAPGHQTGGIKTGGGAGGFSGDREFPRYDANGDGNVNADDNPFIRERARECGGGGGHGTDGQNGDGTSLSQEQHPDGYYGGLGGGAYGDILFSTAPLNSLGVPTLGLGAGGGGGGGGGMEDDGPGSLDGDTLVGPEDSGGGGGGGGGGAIQITARRQVYLFGSTIDASGGVGGRTFNSDNSATGQGAAGGCGAGGSIWLQAYEDDVIVENGSIVSVLGGANDELPSVGQITTSVNDTPQNDQPIEGSGGAGGEGYVRIEDKDGVVLNLGSQVQGALSIGQFRPEADGSYPGRGAEAPMVVNESVAYSKWFNSQLDTPTYIDVYDDPLTPAIEGTRIFEFVEESDGVIKIEARSAVNDPANPGHPSTQPTSWVPLDEVSTISDRRFIQFRITLTLPLNHAFVNPLPYVDFLRINIETQ
jgi:hypothetical protein